MAFRELEIPCPACGAVERRSVADSIDAAERDDLRQQILGDAFQRFACGRCGRRVVVDGPLLYLDFGRHHWIELFPGPWHDRWRSLERAAAGRFRRNVVECAPPLIQAQARDFVVRVVFGIDALREKLIAFDAGIDDRALEAVKLGVLSGEPDLARDPRVRLRLRSAGAASLQLSIDDGRTALGEIRVPRTQLDAAASDAWLPTRNLLLGAYVDIARLFDRPAGLRTSA